MSLAAALVASLALAVEPSVAPPMDWLNPFMERIQLHWRPHCYVEGGSEVKISIQIVLGVAGKLISQPVVTTASGDPDLVAAGVLRARIAIDRSLPIENLPADIVGRPLILKFDAQKACAL